MLQTDTHTQTNTLTVVVRTTAKGRSTADVVAINAEVLAELATLKLNTCNAIKTLYANSYTQQQIIKAGYNASTVYRQCKEYADATAATPTV